MKTLGIIFLVVVCIVACGIGHAWIPFVMAGIVVLAIHCMRYLR